MSVKTLLLALSVVLFGCAPVEESNVKLDSIKSLTESDFERVSNSSYFFGHQSVGRNMLDGLRQLKEEYPALKLDIVEAGDAELVKPGAFLHLNVGENRKPDTKLNEFYSVVDSALGNKVDSAFLKFCYVDLERNGDPQVLFDNYVAKIEELKASHPETTFVHFTLPVKSIPTGVKPTIKRLIGWDFPQLEDNYKRSLYNKMLREKFEGKEPIFDLALYESVAPSTGKKTVYSYKGEKVEAMAEENTYDGGHLTDAGKKWIAEQFVVFLANLERKS